MKGKTTCPYCSQHVVIEVPDGSHGSQKTMCPNCGMDIQVIISHDEEPVVPSIHPSVKQWHPTMILIAGLMLITVSAMGCVIGASLVFNPEGAFTGTGTYHGRVIDTEGQAISGALIFGNDNSTSIFVTTDDDGVFNIGNVSIGKTIIHIEKNGYAPLTATIGVFPLQYTIKERFILTSEEKTSEKKMSAIVYEMLPVIFFFITILFSLPFIGGISCIFRRYKLAAYVGVVSAVVVMSSLLGMSILFGLPSMVYGIGVILSAISLLLIVRSKEDFSRV